MEGLIIISGSNTKKSVGIRPNNRCGGAPWARAAGAAGLGSVELLALRAFISSHQRLIAGLKVLAESKPAATRSSELQELFRPNYRRLFWFYPSCFWVHVRQKHHMRCFLFYLVPNSKAGLPQVAEKHQIMFQESPSSLHENQNRLHPLRTTMRHWDCAGVDGVASTVLRCHRKYGEPAGPQQCWSVACPACKEAPPAAIILRANERPPL